MLKIISGMHVLKSQWLPIVLLFLAAVIITKDIINANKKKNSENENLKAYLASEPVDTVWRGSGKQQIPFYTDSGRLIWYGYELIAHTAKYFGPKGSVAKTTNGMNCQNCHLDGGTLPYGNNFGKVCSTYPQFSARSNGIQTIYTRINDCFERSLNGNALDTSSREMQAICAYIEWVDKDVPKGDVKGGTGLIKLKFMNVAAEPSAGKKIFLEQCASCHNSNGEGQLNKDETEYIYPPLWGKHSYNDGAGLYRIGSCAGFVKYNMPFGTDYHNPKLSDEEAWNVAAFINSQPHPHRDQTSDWKNLKKKPIDFPFGPYVDTFSERQHKYGPFKPVYDYIKLLN